MIVFVERLADTRQKTLLIVDDDLSNTILLKDALELAFHVEENSKSNEFEVVAAENFSDAVRILCDAKRKIIGVTIDNGFHLKSGSGRKGKYRGDDEGIKKQANQEGGAGAMLVRFMRSGNPGAQLKDSEDQLKDVLEEVKGQGYEKRLAELKTVPVIWNTATCELGKVRGIEDAAKGNLIGDTDAHHNAGLLEGEKIYIVDENTACSEKTGMHQKIANFMRAFVDLDVDNSYTYRR